MARNLLRVDSHWCHGQWTREGKPPLDRAELSNHLGTMVGLQYADFYNNTEDSLRLTLAKTRLKTKYLL